MRHDIRAPLLLSGVAGILALQLGGTTSDGAAPATAVPKPALRGPDACAYGFESAEPVELGPGKPAGLSEDRAALLPGEGGEAVYVFRDSDDHRVRLWRIDSSGAVVNRAELEGPKGVKVAHVRAARHGDRLALASIGYRATKLPEIDLALFDLAGHVLWRTVVDPSPLHEHTAVPAFSADGSRIAVAISRGPRSRPRVASVPSELRVAVVDARDGTAVGALEVDGSAIPESIALVEDVSPGSAGGWVLAWNHLSLSEEGAPGLSVVRLDDGGVPTHGGVLYTGVAKNPDLVATPHGVGLTFETPRDDFGETGYIEDSPEGGGVWFVLLDDRFERLFPAAHVSEHPDPLAVPRRPRLAWNGAVFAVAWEVVFSESGFALEPDETWVAAVDPRGGVSPALRLGGAPKAGTRSVAIVASARTGGGFVLAFAREGGVKEGPRGNVVAERIACRASPASVAMPTPPGPCDDHVRAGGYPLARAADRGPMFFALAPGGAGPHGALHTVYTDRHDGPGLHFLLLDPVRGDRLGASVALPSETFLWRATLGSRPGGWSSAWKTGDAVTVALLSGEGKTVAGPIVLAGAISAATGPPCTAWTPRGLMVAWAVNLVVGDRHRGDLYTALVDETGRVLRPAKRVVRHPFGISDCALAPRTPADGPGTGLLYASKDATRTSNLYFALLDEDGLSKGDPGRISTPRDFLDSPAVAARGGAFVAVAAGPFARDLDLLVVDAGGRLLRREDDFVRSYGLTAWAIAPDAGGGLRVIATDGERWHERRVCEPAGP